MPYIHITAHHLPHVVFCPVSVLFSIDEHEYGVSEVVPLWAIIYLFNSRDLKTGYVCTGLETSSFLPAMMKKASRAIYILTLSFRIYKDHEAC